VKELDGGSGGTALQLPRALPRGRSALPRDVVLVSQTQRLLDAVVSCVAEKGYGNTTVADIVARAAVSRATFYQQFRDKEHCFLSAYTVGSKRLFSVLTHSGIDIDEPVARLREGTRVLLDIVAAEPDWSRVFFVEIRTVPQAAERRREVFNWYVDRMRGWHEWATSRLGGQPVPAAVFAAAVAATGELVADELAGGNSDHLAQLEPLIVYIELALLGFPAEAAALAGEADESSATITRSTGGLR
jgi:AcrR family transcriptional regulator